MAGCLRWLTGAVLLIALCYTTTPTESRISVEESEESLESSYLSPENDFLGRDDDTSSTEGDDYESEEDTRPSDVFGPGPLSEIRTRRGAGARRRSGRIKIQQERRRNRWSS
ncbi:hypothetical protein OTU49_014697 [Cherax quadricarinatus]|uniref:Uncharacterized protein n=1 Tax=Cherax quadricarinatus TaxID=27406 RepID=A0AAW0VPZ3_CHEQU|nr:uncharacterized protein LOC128693988 [Cherax quadricarinatus]